MSWSESPTQTNGAHRRRRAPAAPSGSADARRRRPYGTLPQQPPAHYEPYLDGLFTYCLSVLLEHDAAAAALGDALCLAERQRTRLRDPDLRRPWLYALARWVCLRRLAEGRLPTPSPQTAREVAARRTRELASLAWPEAAGTTPEQREALELAVRHQLKPHEVAHVLGTDAEAARTLLARAACEVERTRSALAVVELGRCPAVARLAGDSRARLSPALRRELVNHVDECPRCRVTAERAVADGPWPGLETTAASAVLSVVEAPRSAAYAGLLHAMGTGTGRGRQATPRFDRHGFPVFPAGQKAPLDPAARRARLRSRAVTTTVVAAVVAAPVLAIWAAYQGGTPLGAGERDDTGTVAAARQDPTAYGGEMRQDAGGRTATAAGSAHTAATATTGNARTGRAAAGRPAARPAASVSVSVASADPAVAGGPELKAAGAAAEPGRIAVTAWSDSGDTYLTLTAGGSTPVRWSADTDAGWLDLGERGGILRPGQSTTVVVTVDHGAEPKEPWQARVVLHPSGDAVTIHGDGTPPSASPSPSSPDPGTASPSPSASGGTQPPTPQPSGSPS